MKTSLINIEVLEPDDGMVLTNGETYSTKVYLGVSDTALNWWEIPEEDVPEEGEMDERD